MSEGCKYPACRKPASKSWALIPICESHYEAIRKETEKYYRKIIKNSEREIYNRIKHLTPWG